MTYKNEELMKLAEKVSQDSVWMWSKEKPKE
jgi:hypothetical protein